MTYQLLTKKETALELGGVSISFVDQLLARKCLAKVRLSYRTVRIPLSSVLQYIERRTIKERGGK